MADPARELIVDLFAGGGGASTAILLATGRHPDVAVNHNPIALGVHELNHPDTRHYVCDVREVDPVEATGGRTVGLLWASPDCTHFSKARGGKPVEKHIRHLADVVLVWAEKVRPRVIALENVEEFRDWGPVLADGQPCKASKGLEFRRWKRHLEGLGYAVEDRELVAADYGAPTTRKRLFLIARCDGLPIVWPARTHAPRDKAAGLGLKPWRAAAEILNFNLPCPSIFDRARPLKPKTLARIAKGVKRYVVEARTPFVVPLTHTQGGNTARPGDQPLPTITTAKGGEFAVAVPSIASLAHGDYAKGAGQRVHSVEDTLRTIHAQGGNHALSVATLQRAIGGASVGVGGRAGQSPPRGWDDPLHTVTAKGDRAIAAAALQRLNQNGVGTDPRDPAPTVMESSPKHYQVAAYLGRQFGTAVGRDAGEPHPTVVAGGGGGKSQLVAAGLVQHNGRSIGRAAGEPAPTATAHTNKQQLVAASLDAYYATGVPASADRPLRSVTATDRHGLTSAFLEQANTGMVGHAATSPVSTITGRGTQQRLVELGLRPEGEAGERRAQVLAFLWAHFGEPDDADWADPVGTAQARLRFGLVMIDGQAWSIVDIGMRMLTPRELFSAQGFPPGYIIDRLPDGSAVTKTAQTSLAGNSVSPPPAEALLRANLTWLWLGERAAA